MAIEWRKIAFADDAILKTVLGTTGDLLHRNEAGEPDGLAIGAADGKVLSLSSSLPVWIDEPASAAHAASHRSDGVTDVIALSDLKAEGNVAFAGFEAKDFVVQNKTTPPATPVLGKWYYDTDTDTGLHLCTSIAQVKRMIDISKSTVENMAKLNNDIVELIDACPLSPLEVAMVLKIIQETLLKAFEMRAKEVA